MDAVRADNLTAAVEAQAAPRRGFFARLSAGALTVLASGVAVSVVEAKKRKKRKKKKKKDTPGEPLCERCPKICETSSIVACKPVADISVEFCVCAWTTTGDVACVDIVGLSAGCVPGDECQFDGDCGANMACILVDAVHCCTPGNTGNRCFPKCDV